LQLYQLQGLKPSLPLLCGEFAFALYDREEDCLTWYATASASSCSTGVRPRTASFLASRFKAMFVHPAVKRRYSPEELYHQLMQTMVPGTAAFEGIHQVKSGHLV